MEEAHSDRVARIARAYLWSFLAWAAFMPVLAGQDKVALMARGQHTAYWILILVNGGWLFAAAVLTPPIFAMVHRYPITKTAGASRIIGYILGSAGYMVAAACIRWLILPPWHSPTQQFGHRTLQGFLNGFRIFADLIWDYFVIVAAAHAYEYFSRARKEAVERAELQQALAASELEVLKSQLHPHFLFNTLHSIHALVDTDQERAKAMILKVSNLLRTALEHGNADVVALDEELKFIEDYLSLEKMRLEERLDLRWRVEPNTRELLVPQLILQPLVENSILHGVACCRTGGWIEVASCRNNGTLRIQIRNSVGGVRHGGMGLGLANTRARLKHLYGEQVASLSFDLSSESVATALLVIPEIASGAKAPPLVPAGAGNSE